MILVLYDIFAHHADNGESLMLECTPQDVVRSVLLCEKRVDLTG